MRFQWFGFSVQFQRKFSCSVCVVGWLVACLLACLFSYLFDYLFTHLFSYLRTLDVVFVVLCISLFFSIRFLKKIIMEGEVEWGRDGWKEEKRDRWE